jgi:hypothetical protein
MPEGRYALLADDGAVNAHEYFRCAPGPGGWRYFGEVAWAEDPDGPRNVVDLAVDRDWRIARLRLHTADHDLLLEPRGSALVGYLDGLQVEFPFGRDDHLAHLTPATSAVSCRRLGNTSEIDVLHIAPDTLEPSRERHRYEHHGTGSVDTPSGRFLADHWTFTDLGTDLSADLWVAGDTVVRYERRLTLEGYEAGASGVAPLSPPSGPPR